VNAHARDRQGQQPLASVDALAETRDCRSPDDLLEAPVGDVGDEEASGIRSLIDGRDSHLRG
jgi:hypothetical protein